MKNVRLLDCTLRDGGRVINCTFPEEEIKEISKRLARAGVDIIEIGFLRDHREVSYNGNSTFFTDVEQMVPFVDRNYENIIYTAFIDYGMFDFDSLKPCSDDSINGIRFGFTKANYVGNRDEIVKCCRTIKEKGYKLFVQGVNSLSYNDGELLGVIDLINEIHPYSFGIVDTYGAMYIEDVHRIYSLIDHNMDSDICIDFHSHNNYQLSFALSQEIIKLAAVNERNIILDGTLGGMGKVAGNLNLELIADYLVRRCNRYYDIDAIFDILDQYIYKYSQKHKWGYSAESLMAGIYQSHPNNVIYLTEKFSLETKDIGKILSMISPEKRFRYDYDNIERLYIEYTSRKIDDTETLQKLREIITEHEVLVLVPGSSLNQYREEILAYINEKCPVVISVNFVADHEKSIAFFGNDKSYRRAREKRQGHKIIITSNVKTDDNEDTYIINYESVIDRDFKFFENSTMMLLRMLQKLQPSKISIAGFDGFNINLESNFSDNTFQNDRYIDKFGEMNYEIMEMFKKYSDTQKKQCEIMFITPSIFDPDL